MNEIPDSVLTRLFSPQAKICLASRLHFLLFALTHKGSQAEPHSNDPTRKIPKQSLPTLKPQTFCFSSLFAHLTCTQNFLRWSKPSPHSVLFPHQSWTEFPLPKKMQRKKVILSFHFGFLYQNPCSSHFHLRFSLLQLWKVPSLTSETNSINTRHSHEMSCSLHIYSFASPPRIHMDSWWATRNPNQGPKYCPRQIWSL